jgi:hypothetical protein
MHYSPLLSIKHRLFLVNSLALVPVVIPYLTRSNKRQNSNLLTLSHESVQGTTMKSLVKLLKITLAQEDKETLNEEINNKLFDHIMGGIESVSGKFGHYYIGV